MYCIPSVFVLSSYRMNVVFVLCLSCIRLAICLVVVLKMSCVSLVFVWSLYFIRVVIVLELVCGCVAYGIATVFLC